MNLISRLRRALFGDPIRIASDEGRLLRLQIGQRVILDDALFVVAERDELRDARNPGVRYCLVTYDEAAGPTRLPDAPCVIDSRRLEADYQGTDVSIVTAPPLRSNAGPLAVDDNANPPDTSHASCIWLDCRLVRKRVT